MVASLFHEGALHHNFRCCRANDPGVYLGYAPGNTRKTLRLSCVEKKKTAVEFSPSVDGVLNLKPGELEEKPGGGIPKVRWLLFGILSSRRGKLSQFRPE